MIDFLSFYIYFLGVRFHLFTALLIGLTFAAGLGLLGRVKPLNRVVASTALCAFAVHLYETFHACAQYVFTGETGWSSLLAINVPSVILSLLVVRRYGNLGRGGCIPAFSALIGLVSALWIMGVQGFFTTWEYSPVWAVSKIMASLAALAVVYPYGVGS